jgi:hypothetical protein
MSLATLSVDLVNYGACECLLCHWGGRSCRDVVEMPVAFARGHKAAWRARGRQGKRGSKVQWVADVLCGCWRSSKMVGVDCLIV